MSIDPVEAKRRLILALVEARRGEELALMMHGASRYCRKENDGSVIYPEALRRSAPSVHAASDVASHLEFTALFGTAALSAVKGGRRYFAYPAEFNLWLDLGAPGLFVDEIEAYVAENPL